MATGFPSKQQVANYESNLLSLYNILPQQNIPQLYKQFGKAMGEFEFLMFASQKDGKRLQIKNRTIHHYEEQANQRVVTTNGSISTGAAGANITVILAATDYDANNNRPLRIGDTLLIPKANQPAAVGQTRTYRIQSIANTGAASEYTCSPLLATSQISVAISSGTELMIGANLHAEGSGQPDGRATTLVERTHTTTIAKETKNLEGGMISLETYEANLEGGMPDYGARAVAELEFELSDQQNTQVWIGEENTNSVVEATNSNGNKNVRSGKGIWTWADELAQDKNYIGNFLIDDFEDMKGLFESQYVTSQEILLLTGSNLYNQIEAAGLDYIKEFSGGSDLLRMYNDALTLVGMPYQKIKKNSFTYCHAQSMSLTNPNRFGNDSYHFTDAGLAIPIGNTRVAYDEARPTDLSPIPYLSLAFLNNNGEDRTRIIQKVAGVNGSGLSASNAFDETNIYALSEFAVIAAEVNKWIKIEKA